MRGLRYTRGYPDSFSIYLYEDRVGKVNIDLWEPLINNTDNLPSVIIPEGVTIIPPYCFFNCRQLKKIILPSSITRICSNAFKGCDSLEYVEIPDSVIEIGERAFEDCSALTNIEIPNSVKEIGYCAFAGCTRLESIYIPSSVSVIVSKDNSGAVQYPVYFPRCKSLSKIIVSDDNPTYSSENNCLLSKVRTVLYQGCLSSVIPETVTRIEPFAFNGVSLKSIHFPKLVDNIHEIFFDAESVEVYPENPYFASQDNCVLNKNRTLLIKGCKSSVIPISVTAIGRYAFCQCTSLVSINIPDNVHSIGFGAFKGCSNLKHIELPPSIDKLSFETFAFCDSLSEVEIPNSVKEIESWAFKHCSSLRSILIPSQVLVISESAFDTCREVSSIIVSKDNPCYSSSNNCLLSKDKTILYLGCKGSSIPYGVKTILNWTRLTGRIKPSKVVIPNSVTHIGDYAFAGFSEISSIEIPDSVIEIGNCAFKNCISLTGITFGKSVARIGCEAFSGCSALSSVELPDSLQEIGRGAFCGCLKLTEAKIPKIVTTVRAGCFESCSALKVIDLSNEVSLIEESAFRRCHSLALFKTPTHLMSIGAYAFEGTAIQSFDIPESVTSIGEGNFDHVSHFRLFKYNLEDAEKLLAPILASEKIHNITLSVPIGTGYSYRHHHFFSDFDEIKPEL